jgi:hypothetical protein
MAEQRKVFGPSFFCLGGVQRGGVDRPAKIELNRIPTSRADVVFLVDAPVLAPCTGGICWECGAGMDDRDVVIEQIQEAFAGNIYPGDAFLQGSTEGSEPYEEVGSFVGKNDWRTLDPTMLDSHYSALSFFSEEGFRFFLPAYLIADLRDELQAADPLFHLTWGFHVTSVEVAVGARVFVRETGGSTLLNPRRYGAMTCEDYARYRLSVFAKEEAQAIVAYLRYKRDHDPYAIDTTQIDAALDSFWLDRAERAPSTGSLAGHIRKEDEFVAHLDAP